MIFQGGKSTLLRQTCIAIIMAQLGCFIPARSCEMTLFDRIFTRIGTLIADCRYEY
jgi:DNA mismatch repair protein MSH6